MIADLVFPGGRGVRAPALVPRSSIPIDAARLVANGVREALRELLGGGCELALGEPAAIDAAAWALLAREALLFVTRGRQTDVVLVVPRGDARRLVRRAFGEGGDEPGPCSALELRALERIAARCAPTFDALCAERTGSARAVALDAAPRCVAYFDLRLGAPVAATLGVGIARRLPDPGPSRRLAAEALRAVPIAVRAVVARGTLAAARAAALRPGDVVALDTPLDGASELRAGGELVARGRCGALGARLAFRVGGAA